MFKIQKYVVFICMQLQDLSPHKLDGEGLAIWP